MTDQSVHEASSGKPDAAQAGATVTPPADPSAPLAPLAPLVSGKPVGTRLGFSNYLGLAGALLAMIVLFSLPDRLSDVRDVRRDRQSVR